MDGVKTLLALVHHHLFLGTRLSRCIEESDNLPDPDVLAQEIVEDVEAEHEQFHEIAADLRADVPTEKDQ